MSTEESFTTKPSYGERAVFWLCLLFLGGLGWFITLLILAGSTSQLGLTYNGGCTHERSLNCTFKEALSKIQVNTQTHAFDVAAGIQFLAPPQSAVHPDDCKPCWLWEDELKNLKNMRNISDIGCQAPVDTDVLPCDCKVASRCVYMICANPGLCSEEEPAWMTSDDDEPNRGLCKVPIEAGLCSEEESVWMTSDDDEAGSLGMQGVMKEKPTTASNSGISFWALVKKWIETPKDFEIGRNPFPGLGLLDWLFAWSVGLVVSIFYYQSQNLDWAPYKEVDWPCCCKKTIAFRVAHRQLLFALISILIPCAFWTAACKSKEGRRRGSLQWHQDCTNLAGSSMEEAWLVKERIPIGLWGSGAEHWRLYARFNDTTIMTDLNHLSYVSDMEIVGSDAKIQCQRVDYAANDNQLSNGWNAFLWYIQSKGGHWSIKLPLSSPQVTMSQLEAHAKAYVLEHSKYFINGDNCQEYGLNLSRYVGGHEAIEKIGEKQTIKDVWYQVWFGPLIAHVVFALLAVGVPALCLLIYNALEFRRKKQENMDKLNKAIEGRAAEEKIRSTAEFEKEKLLNERSFFQFSYPEEAKMRDLKIAASNTKIAEHAQQVEKLSRHLEGSHDDMEKDPLKTSDLLSQIDIGNSSKSKERLTLATLQQQGWYCLGSCKMQ